MPICEKRSDQMTELELRIALNQLEIKITLGEATPSDADKLSEVRSRLRRIEAVRDGKTWE